jgi:hypothetical protein
MRPQRVMLHLKLLDKHRFKQEADLKIPCVELSDLVFFRVSNLEMDKMKLQGRLDEFMAHIARVAQEKEKMFVFLPEGVELLEVTEKWENMTEEEADRLFPAATKAPEKLMTDISIDGAPIETVPIRKKKKQRG